MTLNEPFLKSVNNFFNLDYATKDAIMSSLGRTKKSYFSATILSSTKDMLREVKHCIYSLEIVFYLG